MSTPTNEIWRPAYNTKPRWVVYPDQSYELQVPMQNRQTGEIRFETVQTVMVDANGNELG